MRVETSANNPTSLFFKGKLKGQENFLEIKQTIKNFLQNCKKEDPIYFFFDTKCYPLELYFVGYLLKLKETDQWDIRVHTNELRMMRFFEGLKLDKRFDVIFREI